MARRPISTSTPKALILDAGAVIALARGDARARAYVVRAVEIGADVYVPPVVVAETVRGDGPKDAGVNRVLRAVGEIPPTTEEVARAAGRLLGKTRSKATVDALVVAEALLRSARVLTSDPRDLRRLGTAASGVVVHSLAEQDSV